MVKYFNIAYFHFLNGRFLLFPHTLTTIWNFFLNILIVVHDEPGIKLRIPHNNMH